MPKGDEKEVKGNYDTNNDGVVDKQDDLNNDGRANKKDRDLKRDEISNALLGRDYKYAARLLDSNPEIAEIFKDAVKNGWEPTRFEAAVKNSGWYGDIGGEYARKAWFSKTLGGPDWDDQLNQARDSIQRVATQMGVQLSPEEIGSFAERYIFEGWFESSRQGLMADALASKAQADAGGNVKVRDELATIARENGVKVNDQWYNEVVQSIARGDSTQADYEMYLRDQAAAKFPLYADKIKAGVSVKSLVSPYTRRMAELFDINQDDISFDDPYISSVLTALDENGNPKVTNFADFETTLRRDPRWLESEDGSKAFMGLAAKMARDWGFVTDSGKMVV
jgi:hypothetical protein